MCFVHDSLYVVQTQLRFMVLVMIKVTETTMVSCLSDVDLILRTKDCLCAAQVSLASQMILSCPYLSLCVLLHFEIHLMLFLTLEMLCGFGNGLWDFLVLLLTIKYIVYKTNLISGYLWTLILPQLISSFIAKVPCRLLDGQHMRNYIWRMEWSFTEYCLWEFVHHKFPLTTQLLGICNKNHGRYNLESIKMIYSGF